MGSTSSRGFGGSRYGASDHCSRARSSLSSRYIACTSHTPSFDRAANRVVKKNMGLHPCPSHSFEWLRPSAPVGPYAGLTARSRNGRE